jgi:hypothetical protein
MNYTKPPEHPDLTKEQSSLFHKLLEDWRDGKRFEVSCDVQNLSTSDAVIFISFMLQYAGITAVHHLARLIK